ncbi:prolactin-releasing peptide receptor-like [Macrosteles quadrilineatus]|uniref:prolactin-releasing peptide receptor-like n=1 Tax=Macrosteles quadrilineatus TaxID=74068 RepID=UPI0023E2BE74|nr:prolactin-releasing peptide receptor-like [Macrosteles quadrilineatus]
MRTTDPDDTELEESENLPHKFLEQVIHYFHHGTKHNGSVDLREPQLRYSFVSLYPLFVLLYSMIVTVGTLSNGVMIYVIFRDRLYKDQTFCYFINLALSDMVKCIFVLPISLMVILIHNWIFGSFLCYFLPMMQDIPMHVSMLTYLLIAFDRFRYLQDPTKARIPAFVMATGSWLMALCIVLPYPIYTTYVDLGTFGKEYLEGVGICAVNLADDMQEYVRGLFFAMYVLPLTTIAYLYVRMSREIEVKEGPLAVIMYEARSRTNSNGSPRSVSQGQAHFRYRSPTANFDLYENELDIKKEKKVQQYLITMVTVFGICLCPLMVLRLAKMAVAETYENTGHFDLTYVTFVWVAFLPTCTTPLLFIYWRMNKSTKERLRGYLRLSNRHLRRNCESPPDHRRGDVMTRLGMDSGRNSEGTLSTTPVINNS